MNENNWFAFFLLLFSRLCLKSGAISDKISFQIFVKLERPSLEARTAELRANAILARDNFIQNLTETVVSRDFDAENFVIKLEEQLVLYEVAAQNAVEGGLDLLKDPINGDFPSKKDKWTMPQAIFFASTVCTTIGSYQNNFFHLVKFNLL
jgi:hypothetical protein